MFTVFVNVSLQGGGIVLYASLRTEQFVHGLCLGVAADVVVVHEVGGSRYHQRHTLLVLILAYKGDAVQHIGHVLHLFLLQRGAHHECTLVIAAYLSLYALLRREEVYLWSARLLGRDCLSVTCSLETYYYHVISEGGEVGALIAYAFALIAHACRCRGEVEPTAVHTLFVCRSLYEQSAHSLVCHAVTSLVTVCHDVFHTQALGALVILLPQCLAYAVEHSEGVGVTVAVRTAAPEGVFVEEKCVTLYCRAYHGSQMAVANRQGLLPVSSGT